ncbi:DUF6572 domain-containing protein [Pseudomonas protegens]|uniref:DUF6572 domain-containing protein n=1 Tax=Pseudomonas protegens TaxID=380021 RepID=UPI00215D9F91|nr:DUF6572 domain-containing protein [Pseudomonas protegens]
MSITNPKVIDIWAIPKSAPDSLLLIMVDPLEWGDEAAHSEHLLLLQEKINTYITFIESEEIYSEIPDACSKHLIIRVLGLHELPEQVDWFFKRITEILHERSIGFDFELKVNEEAPSL